MNVSPTVKQVTYSLAVILNMMSLGMGIGFAAILVPALSDPDNGDLVANQNQTSWLASLPGVSGLIPLLVIGPLMKIHGRKVTNICTTIPMIAGWLLTFSSNSITVLFISRVLHSFGLGCVYFYATCISEFSDPRIRGVLLNMKIFVISIGSALMHVFGYFLHWRYLALIATIPVTLALLITLFWPETPDWLVSRGKFEEAEIVYYSLRGQSETSRLELLKVIEDAKTEHKLNKSISALEFSKQLLSPTLWRPIALLFCGIVIPEFGGRIFFPSYSIELLTEITGESTRGYIYTFVLDAIVIISNLFSFYLVKKFNRRTLMLYPTYCAIVVLEVSVALLFVRSNYFESKALVETTVVLLFIYFSIVTATTFAIAYVFMGELLPLEFRSEGTVISGVLNCTTSTLTTQIMPIMRSNLGVHGMFFIYSLCMLLTTTYLHFDLPETKDRTLQDIANYFKGKAPKVKQNQEMKPKL